MGKKKVSNRPGGQPPRQAADGTIPVVGAREPCPCGSGRRYKACHGREASHAVQELVKRPFAGLADECDWVALRELVPAATSPLRLSAEYTPEGETVAVELSTVLPMAWPAIRRSDGTVLLGLQTQSSSGDVSRDAAHALLSALRVEPGSEVTVDRPEPGGPRLQDVLDPAAPLVVTVHPGFDYWIDEVEDTGGELRASLDRANAAVIPTERLSSVGTGAAYWCDAGDKNHLRWVMPHEEDELLDALARLYAAGAAGLGEGTRFVGSFRAHGLLVPVWDLPSETTAEMIEEPAAAFADRLKDALSASEPLTASQRRARSGLLNRQITLS